MAKRLSFFLLLIMVGCGTTTVTNEPPSVGPASNAASAADQPPVAVEEPKPAAEPPAQPSPAAQFPPEPAKPVEPPPASPDPLPPPAEPAQPTDTPDTPADVTLAVFPAPGTDEFSKLVAVTDLKTILAMLEEKARSEPTVKNQLVAAAALVSSTSILKQPENSAWESADLLMDRIKISPEADPQWVRMLRAQLERLTGQPERALREVGALYRECLREMPPELGDLYFTYASIASANAPGGERMRDENGFDLLRRLPDGSGQNDVFGSKDTVYVAYRFRYLTGTRIENKDKWHYKLQATAELFDAGEADPQRARVASFNWQPKTLETKFGHAPDQWEGGRLTFNLPYDIKAQRDYTLKITFTDLNAPKEKNLVGTKEITVKVR